MNQGTTRVRHGGTGHARVLFTCNVRTPAGSGEVEIQEVAVLAASSHTIATSRCKISLETAEQTRLTHQLRPSIACPIFINPDGNSHLQVPRHHKPLTKA